MVYSVLFCDIRKDVCDRTYAGKYVRIVCRIVRTCCISTYLLEILEAEQLNAGDIAMIVSLRIRIYINLAARSRLGGALAEPKKHIYIN